MLRRLLPLLLVLACAYGFYRYATQPPAMLTLTGVVTTHDVAVAPQIGGRLVSLAVKEGDAVAKDQVLAEIEPSELEADRAYYEQTALGAAAQIREAEAALRLQQEQVRDQIAQAEAMVKTSEAEVAAARADAERARVTLDRTLGLAKAQLATGQALDDARTASDAARARVESLDRQVDAARASLALAHTNAEQVAVRRSQLQASHHQLAAAGAQRSKADVRLGFTRVLAPLAGIVDVEPARQGEIVAAGQTVLTLIDPDDLWVRADIEETYVGHIKIGDKLTVRLPSGEEREGRVFYRRADASFATQRDVSRTKRDIRTFETRLRVDNHDRALAVGMTAYVLLPLGGA